MKTIACACGCGTRMPARMANGKKRKFWRGHGDSGRQMTRCAGCGKRFLVHQWRLERFPKVFCSRTCSAKDRIKTHTTRCGTCGKPVIRHRKMEGEKAYCNQACKSQGMRARAKKMLVRCSQCSKPLQVFPSKMKQRHFYCDPRCRASHIRGANNPSFTTGAGRNFYYGDNWKQQRQRALRRDKRTCQLCGTVQTRPREMEVHHRMPIATFGGNWLAANDLANLVTLCFYPCHRLAEATPSVLDFMSK